KGTARRAFIDTPYQAAGKTGTAQVFSLRGAKYQAQKIDERLRDHALFMAYAPADAPQIAVALIVENGGWGSTAAAPIAREVFDYWLLERNNWPVEQKRFQPIDRAEDSEHNAPIPLAASLDGSES
ncbi:MAG TPA: penicillin-binding transpeptidase domain-containing protein, partial [Burkholderiaceae bacterium]|nr:penicillin-binding transpeptidase domain-containing protein [Burkholderiaceae bacterium]